MYISSKIYSLGLIYHGKNVTPYMHVVQFFEFYHSVICFTPQGLEKLNELTTKYIFSIQLIIMKRSLLQICTSKQSCLESSREQSNFRSAWSTKLQVTINALVVLQMLNCSNCSEWTCKWTWVRLWTWKWTGSGVFWHVKRHIREIRY